MPPVIRFFVCGIIACSDQKRKFLFGDLLQALIRFWTLIIDKWLFFGKLLCSVGIELNSHSVNYEGWKLFVVKMSEVSSGKLKERNSWMSKCWQMSSRVWGLSSWEKGGPGWMLESSCGCWALMWERRSVSITGWEEELLIGWIMEIEILLKCSNISANLAVSARTFEFCNLWYLEQIKNG